MPVKDLRNIIKKKFINYDSLEIIVYFLGPFRNYDGFSFSTVFLTP